jgi:hypothetical protein
MVGLQHYCGDFTLFPIVAAIENMIARYKSAPIAYTLDVGVSSVPYKSTFVIEVHDFFSCGLYGFMDATKLPFMFSRWFHNYVNNVQIY